MSLKKWKKTGFAVLMVGLLVSFIGCSSSKPEEDKSVEVSSVAAENNAAEYEKAEDTDASEESKEEWYLAEEDVTIMDLKKNNGGTLHYVYSYDENNQLVSVIAENRFERTLSYDENGNLLKDSSATIKSDGSRSLLESTYEYDKKNRLISYQKTQDNKAQESETREYDRKTYTVTSVAERCVYNYDDLLLEEYALDGKGNESLIAKYTYDENGNAIRYEDAGGSYIECTNTYNEDGKLLKVERISHYSNGSEPAYDEIFDYSYDEDGNLLTMIGNHKIRATGKEEMVAYYSYEYEEGNMTYSKTTENDILTENWYDYDEYGNQIYQKTQTENRVIEHNSTYEKR